MMVGLADLDEEDIRVRTMIRLHGAVTAWTIRQDVMQYQVRLADGAIMMVDRDTAFGRQFIHRLSYGQYT